RTRNRRSSRRLVRRRGRRDRLQAARSIRRLLTLHRRVSRIGAHRAALPRTLDSIVARALGRGRPWTILGRRAVRRDRELAVLPGEPHGACLGEPPLIENLSLAPRRRRQRADDDGRARAIFLEGHAVLDEGEGLAFGKRGDAAVAVAGRDLVA